MSSITLLLLRRFHHGYAGLHLGHKGFQLIKVLLIHLILGEDKIFLKREVQSLTLCKRDLDVAAGIVFSSLKTKARINNYCIV